MTYPKIIYAYTYDLEDQMICCSPEERKDRTKYVHDDIVADKDALIASLTAQKFWAEEALEKFKKSEKAPITREEFAKLHSFVCCKENSPKELCDILTRFERNGVIV